MRMFKLNDIEKKCLLIVAILFVIGIVADFYAWINPLENLIVPFLAELAGIFIGIIIAFRLVDTYKDELKKQEWSEIKGFIYQGVLVDLTLVALGIYRQLPIPGISYTIFPTDLKRNIEENKELWNELKANIAIVSEAAEMMLKNPDKEFTVEEHPEGRWHIIELPKTLGNYLAIDMGEINSKFIKRVYRNIRPYLDDIKNIQISRAMGSPDKKELISDLIKFEESIDTYYSNMQGFKAENSSNVFVINSIITLSEDASKLYDKFYQEWKKSQDIK